MANFFYIDNTGTKQGPVSQEELKDLARQGIITPQTLLENDSGRRGTAGSVKGLKELFPNPSELESSADFRLSSAVNPPSDSGKPVNHQVPVQVPLAVNQPGAEKHFCTNCGNEVNEKAVACPKCGVPPRIEKKFCYDCGVGINPNQIICIKCGSQIRSHGGGRIGAGLNKFGDKLGIGNNGQAKRRIAYVLLWLLPQFLCGLCGIHNLYAGRTGIGITQLISGLLNGILGAILTPLTVGLWLFIMIPIGLGLIIWQIIEVCTVTADGNGQPFA